MGALSDEFAKSSVVLDRELDQEKSLDPSGPRIRCPLCGWSPRKDGLLVLYVRALVEHVRYRGRLPCLPAPVGFDSVPFL